MDSVSQKLTAIEQSLTDKNLRSKSRAHLDIAASIGAETSVSILSDIRSLLSQLVIAQQENNRLLEAAEQNNSNRHNDICVALLKDTVASTPATPLHLATSDSSSNGFWYGDTRIISSTNLIGCVLYHLDQLLMAHPRFARIALRDTENYDVKRWSSLTSLTTMSLRDTGNTIYLPKPKDHVFSDIAQLIASSEKGRRPKVNVNVLLSVMEVAPAFTSTLYTVHDTIVKLSGMVTPSKEARFRRLLQPYVNDNLELNIENGKLILPSSVKYEKFSELKAPAKKMVMKQAISEGIDMSKLIL